MALDGRNIADSLHLLAEIANRADSVERETGLPPENAFAALASRATRGLVDVGDWTYRRADGSPLPVQMSITALRDLKGAVSGYLCVATDLTQRQAAESEIRDALAEKETLLKEVYHRVKNNLQVVTSLFNLQLRTLPEGPARVALKESADRVRAMALVHEKLYQSANLSSIDLADYVRDLCRQLASAVDMDQRRIRLVVEADPMQLDLETSIPLGLLLNELISNSLKHGFPDDRSGTVTVRLRVDSDPDWAELEVADDGVGFEGGAPPPPTRSLGVKLARSLSGQLGGSIEMFNRDGACNRVRFRLRPASDSLAHSSSLRASR